MLLYEFNYMFKTAKIHLFSLEFTFLKKNSFFFKKSSL